VPPLPEGRDALAGRHFCLDAARRDTFQEMPETRKRLGELVVEWGLVSAEQLKLALAQQQTDRRRLGVLLIERGFLNGTKLTQLLSHQFQLPFVSLSRVTYTADLVRRVPGRFAHQHRVVPICASGADTLFVATDDPTQEDLAEAASKACNATVRLMVAAPDEVQRVIDAHYAGIATEPPPAPPRNVPPPTGAVAVAVAQPSGVKPAVPSVAAASADVVELSSDDLEDALEPAILVVSPDDGFERLCRGVASSEGLRYESASAGAAERKAAELKPIAVVLKENVFATDRVAFTKLSMEVGAHLIIWSDHLDASYLEPLLATARTKALGRAK
jgi:hypothetical protein